MTTTDYIKSKFQTFGISISEAELLEMSIIGSLTLSDEVSADNMQDISISIAVFIPSLLLRPTSVSEGGFSQTFDPESLKTFYNSECIKYGIENQLVTKITFERVY